MDIDDADLSRSHHDKHKLPDEHVREALSDPERIVDDPGASDSGMTIDVFGFSTTRRRLIRIVIIREPDGSLWAATTYTIKRGPHLARYKEEQR